MEIIHIVPGKANPNRMNGVNKVVHDLASHQASAGIAVSVWGISKNLQHDYPPRNFKTRLFKAGRIPFLLPEELAQAIKQIRHPVVFHLHGGFLPLMYSVSRLLHRQQKPFVLTPHGSYNLIAMEKSKLIKKAYGYFFEKPMLRRSAMIHVLGQSEKESLLTWCCQSKVIQIPYGFNPNNHSARNTKLQKDKFIIGFCGRIDIYTKGLDALIEGYIMFQREYPESELHIIGEGADMPRFRQMIDQTPGIPTVRLHGARYGSEKENLLHQFDVFAHPSRNEGLPAAVLEAASNGIPCLVTKATNMGSFIKDFNAGAAIEHTDGKDIYEALKKLYRTIRTEHREETMKRQARQMIQQAFNWETLQESYITMYRNMLP